MTTLHAPTAHRQPPGFSAPRPNFALMRLLGFINRWFILRGHFRVAHLDLPARDLERLTSAVNDRTAAFLGPNHPEFGLDWMLDKELSTRVAPKMASWAAHEIVRTAPWFWTRNNLIANDGADDALAHSVTWALRGNGVLLHPEGRVHWTADTIHPLFNGVAEMATDAARHAARDGIDRPVFIVPIIWKLRYTHDVSAALHRDMERIEKHLALSSESGASVSERFRRLQEGVLTRQMTRFGFDAHSVRHHDFFARQDAFRAHLVADLERRYAIEPATSAERTIGRLQRAVRAERRATYRADLAIAEEAGRLGGFCRDVYDTPELSQEQIAESLKRIRASFLVRGARNVVHNYLPTPYGPRVAHVRVPEPLRIDADRASGTPDERAAYVAWLVDEARQRMQADLDAVNREIAPMVADLRQPNPFCVPHESREPAPARSGRELRLVQVSQLVSRVEDVADLAR